MTTRLRILHLPGGTPTDPRFALVLDRVGEPSMSMEQYERFCRHFGAGANTIGAVGALCFPDQVDLGQGEPVSAPPTVDPKAILADNGFWEAFERQRRIRGRSYGQIP